VGYKYGGLALQVGGWVTGQEPITVKKPAVRKPELRPQNSQTECNRSTQWNERSKKDLTGRSPLRRQTSTLDCSAIKEEGEEEKD